MTVSLSLSTCVHSDLRLAGPFSHGCINYTLSCGTFLVTMRPDYYVHIVTELSQIEMQSSKRFSSIQGRFHLTAFDLMTERPCLFSSLSSKIISKWLTKLGQHFCALSATVQNLKIRKKSISFQEYISIVSQYLGSWDVCQ